ncbi:Uncharacterized protein dnm_007410 [Desulfonema magnum]|uniref:Uncharacterized protein n=1 Tax=Desulfonema magnum TaxID=45655 RepID=A0A975BG45_9BACT|nr:Uncharacterized protein dnm_007410 [Desulfonema magnum]
MKISDYNGFRGDRPSHVGAGYYPVATNMPPLRGLASILLT